MAKKRDQIKFAVCIENQGCDDLQIWKLYRVSADGYLRVVDESGEDYLYPPRRFVSVEFPAAVEQKLMAAASVA